MRRTTLGHAALALFAATAALAAQNGPDAPPDREAVVRGMLERSRLLEDARFRVPFALWKRVLRDTIQGRVGLAPVPFIAEDAIYRLRVPAAGAPTLSATVRLRIFDPTRCRGLRVLSATQAWEKLAVNGQPAELATEKGWLRFSPPAAGLHVIAAQVPLEKVEADGGSLELPVPPTVRTLLELDSPRAWELTVAGEPRRLRGDPAQGTHGQLAVAPRDTLAFTFRPPAPVTERPPHFQVRGHVAWNLEAGVQQVTARLDVAIIGGRTERLDLVLPDGADRVSIAGHDVRETRVEAGGAVVFLRGRIAENTRLHVRCEMPIAKGGTQRFGTLAVRQGRWTGGTLVVTNTAGGSEVLAESAEGLRELALSEIPAGASAMLAGPPALAYAVTGRRWTASVEAVNLGDFALRESIADTAHFQLVYRPDGTMLVKAEYEIRNRAKQFLRIQLPPGARVLLARVNETSRPVTPVAGQRDAILLPLIRSRASVMGLVSFPVELLVLCRIGALARRGEARLPLPRIDLPVAYAWCEAYVPEGLRVRRWTGPLKQVDRYSSETATASFEYGRAELARGYKRKKPLRPEKAAVPKPTPKRRRTPFFGWLSGLTGPAAKEQARVSVPKTLPKKPTTEWEPAPPPKTPAVATRQRPDGELTREALTESIKKTIAPGTWPDVGRNTALLAKNHWRAAQDFYARGDLSNAQVSLKQVLKLAPKSVEAANARRLLSNVRLAQGKLALRSKAERAAGAKVQRAIDVANRPLLEQQRKYLEAGLRAAREGRREEAKTQLGAAVSLGGQLTAQGASVREQDAILRTGKEELSKLRTHELTEARELYEKVKRLKTKGRYGEALRTAKQLQKFQVGQHARVQKEVQELTVKAARQKAQAQKAQPTGGGKRQRDEAVTPTQKAAERLLERYGRELAVRQDVDRRRAATRAIGGELHMPQEWELRIREALSRKVSFDFTETPLQDVLSFLGSLVDVSIVVDPDVYADGAPTITLKVDGMRLDAALSWICKLADLRYVVRDEAIYIARPVRAFLKPAPPRGPVPLEDRVRGVLEGYKPGKPSKAELRIREALGKKISFDFVETPVQDVVSFLGSLVEVTLVLDADALKDDAPTVTLKVNDMRLESALNWVMKLTGLTYTLQDEAIVVTSPEPFGPAPVRVDPRIEAPVVREYAVADLLVDPDALKVLRGDKAEEDEKLAEQLFGDAGKATRLTPDQLIDQIKTAIAAESWDAAPEGTTVTERAPFTIVYRNGNIVVTHRPTVHKRIGRLIEQFRKTRGPQVQLGQTITEQKARGIVLLTDGSESMDKNGDGRRVGAEVLRFIERNYDWQLAAGKYGDQVQAWFKALPKQREKRVEKLAVALGGNLGQKVQMNSVNFDLAERDANSLGVHFTPGNNGLRFAVIDEAQFRTLLELDQAGEAAGRRVAANPRNQETIVGTGALLANGMVANVRFAADRGNTIDVLNNPVNLEHHNYILIDNGGYLTALRAGHMQHWTERAAPIVFQAAPQNLEVPRVGRLVRFEKTLVEPGDDLALRAAYRWRGETR